MGPLQRYTLVEQSLASLSISCKPTSPLEKLPRAIQLHITSYLFSTSDYASWPKNREQFFTLSKVLHNLENDFITESPYINKRIAIIFNRNNGNFDLNQFKGSPVAKEYLKQKGGNLTKLDLQGNSLKTYTIVRKRVSESVTLCTFVIRKPEKTIEVKEVKGSLLAQLADFFPKIRALNLSGCTIDKQDFDALLLYKNLTSLNIGGARSKIDAEGWKKLLQATQLEELVLEEEENLLFTEDLTEYLQNLQRLQITKRSSNFSQAHLTTIAACRHLQSLKLLQRGAYSHWLTADQLQKLQQLPRLEHLEMTALSFLDKQEKQAIGELTTLKHLALDFKESGTTLCDLSAFETLTALKTLQIQTPRSFIYTLDASQLKILEQVEVLSWNGLCKAQHFEELQKVSFSSLRHLELIGEFTMDDITILQNLPIKLLFLRSSKLSDTCISSLITWIRSHCTKLQELILRGNFNKTAVLQLQQALPTVAVDVS